MNKNIYKFSKKATRLKVAFTYIYYLLMEKGSRSI